MRSVTTPLLVPACCLFLLLLLPLTASALPAISCHCFTDRSYDPTHPAAADPYFLATTQNSFFAAVFGIDKKQVVIKKQTGSSADDLWVAYWLAARSGISADLLLQKRSAAVSWREVVAAQGATVQKTTGGFRRELQGGASGATLARLAVDEILVQRRLLSEGELALLRVEWAGNQEVILATLIASRTGRTAVQIYREVKKGGRSWGALLQEAKIEPAFIQRSVAALLGKSSR